jgi:hypothetical protein
LLQHLIVPIARDGKAFSRQGCVSSGIALRLCMLASIDLDHKALLEADKIENVILERDLPPKLECGKPTVSQQAPHCGFGIRWFVPHILRKLAERFGDRPMGRILRH